MVIFFSLNFSIDYRGGRDGSRSPRVAGGESDSDTGGSRRGATSLKEGGASPTPSASGDLANSLKLLQGGGSGSTPNISFGPPLAPPSFLPYLYPPGLYPPHQLNSLLLPGGAPSMNPSAYPSSSLSTLSHNLLLSHMALASQSLLSAAPGYLSSLGVQHSNPGSSVSSLLNASLLNPLKAASSLHTPSRFSPYSLVKNEGSPPPQPQPSPGASAFEPVARSSPAPEAPSTSNGQSLPSELKSIEKMVNGLERRDKLTMDGFTRLESK